MTLVVIILAVLVVGLVLLLLKKQTSPKEDSSAALLLKEDLKTLVEGMSQLKDTLGDKIDSRLEKSQTSMGQQLQESAKLIKDVTAR